MIRVLLLRHKTFLLRRPPMSNQVFGSRAGNVRHLLRTIQLQTGGSYALIAYRGNNDDPHRVVDANPSVEEVQARLGYEPNPEPVELIDRVVAHEHLQELTNEQLLELENLLDTILHLVRTEQEVRAAAA